MMIRLFLLLFILVLSGCSIKNSAIRSESSLLLIKSKKLKFYDMAFVNYSGDNSFSLELFNSSKAFLKLEVYKDMICKDNLCSDIDSFNKDYLYEYKFNIFYYLFYKKPIPNYNYSKNEKGFSQKIVSDDYSI
jgi:hypothetical protein